MKHYIIGTAGHVDHGKSALIRALTGVETDRLPEEKERGISIDIGFARFPLPSGRRAAVIDVPGHEKFVRNMLAGITGIDLVILVVAADEGVMPQTREHLDILRLLEISKGLVAITKIDLVDEEMVELVEADVAEAVAGTFLEGAPVCRVSSVTGEGLDHLLRTVDALLAETEPKDTTAFARLPIDRAFVRPGFGTVVTGTLVGGVIRQGDRMELLPLGIEVRVRGLQVHGEPVELAQAGQRVAVNLAGIERSDVRRGHVLCAPGALRPTRSFAGRLHLLESWPKELKHGERVHLHTGTSEVLARVLLLEGDALKPGGTAYVQLKLEEPVVVGRGDRYIIRSYSPVHTVGGGMVIEPHAQYRRSQAKAAIAELQAKESGGTGGVIAETLLRAGMTPLGLGELAKRTGVTVETVRTELPGLGADVRELEGGLWIHRRGFGQFCDAVRAELETFYGRYPLRSGLGKEELRRKLGLGGKEFAALLAAAEAAGELSVNRDRVALPGRAPALNGAQAKLAERLRAAIAGAGFSPLTVAELKQQVPGADTEEVIIYLIEQGEAVRVGDDLVIAAPVLEEAVRRTREHLKARGRLTVAEFRDLLGTSRKYALPLLEWMDEQRITRRAGEERVAGPNG
ncbi:selenocysteine-specific translation elongation factor [Symbiobacterium thermophilum]|uniref:selenocysteine-specific translation elongation factor n=1 Tax=Symbiobacterium thermophilum TaxID=2734 RepID=UPI002353B279|nr:selenocysteine-specific translation elongation factor [Symbiobacterium thermophilum]